MNISEIVNYEVLIGNPIWRLALMLLVVLVTLVVGRIVQFKSASFVARISKSSPDNIRMLVLRSLLKPINIAFFALTIAFAKLCLRFDNPDSTNTVEGIAQHISTGWDKVASALWAITIAYAIYQLVDVVEHFLQKAADRTQTKLDNMLIPIVRKSLRIVIAIVAILIVAENIFGTDNIKSLILSAGVGGIAVALAAKTTIENFFGSLTIFSDKPFQIDDLIEIGDSKGVVEEVGFRSTKLRTLDGHQISIPNSTVANTEIENITRRPDIKRMTSITITYDSGYEKTQKAVDIIKQILSKYSEVNGNPDKPPRVYFDNFGAFSLDILVVYWFSPSDYWIFKEVSEKINFEILKSFDEAGIEFAFPTQTLYLKNEAKQC